MKQKALYYTYPAILTYYPKEKEIAVEFIDLGVATSGVNDADALNSARELLGLTMVSLEDDNEKIPSPTSLNKIALKKNEKAILVDVYMPSIRNKCINHSVNRTVTLPAWLNSLAVEKGINFSEALKNTLINDYGLK